jgi:hypothetical protein
VTTNLDAQRTAIWDMGEIAASDDPGALNLFRNVLTASASIPGVFAVTGSIFRNARSANAADEVIE